MYILLNKRIASRYLVKEGNGVSSLKMWTYGTTAVVSEHFNVTELNTIYDNRLQLKYRQNVFLYLSNRLGSILETFLQSEKGFPIRITFSLIRRVLNQPDLFEPITSKKLENICCLLFQERKS